ncbi:MAG: formate dehydrogenase accessory sulfurtransferase FdhD [Puniceicoccaceae bacterium]
MPVIKPTYQRTHIEVIKQRVEGLRHHSPETDYLAIEDPMEITLRSGNNGSATEQQLLVTMRTPGEDRELIHGLLFTEEIIHSAQDIREIQFERTKEQAAPVKAMVHLRTNLPGESARTNRWGSVNSSCGVCGKTSMEQLVIRQDVGNRDPVRINSSLIHELPERMRRTQTTFHHTGGLHASALFDASGTLLCASEDIGRHNALDKVIGKVLLNPELHSESTILCVSGRMSYEILQKAIMARIPVIAGIGAPSSLAVAIANDFNITLLGFVRDNAFNIYSAPERIRKTA